MKKFLSLFCALVMAFSVFTGGKATVVNAEETLYAAYSHDGAGWNAPISVGDSGKYIVAYCFNQHKEAPPSNQQDPYGGGVDHHIKRKIIIGM